jgi:glycosyltransferase involved in cell wall biosynthesis
MPKLLYFATEDWSFCQHFLPMARAARALGCEVVVATRVRAHAQRLAAEGFRVVSLESERGSFALVEIVRSMLRMRAIVRAERPDIIHCIGIRMVTLGGLSVRLANPRQALVLAPTGLGLLWMVDDPFHRVGRWLIRWVVGRCLRGPQTFYLFENADDPAEFGLAATGCRVTLVGGAGVDPGEFQLSSEPPAPPVKVAVVARMVRTKGIAEAVAAVRGARGQGAPVELHLFGPPDPSNRRSFTEAELRKWSAEPGIHWHGESDDIARVWREHHVAMLLSYREGLPRCLVEAAAVGRPIVASNVIGSRELVRDGVEGILVPPGDVRAAAASLARLAADPGLRGRLGAAAHRRFRERFTEEAVKGVLGALYQRILREWG